MSKVKISENLFLEKNELVRMQEFSGKNGWQRAFRSLVKRYGIVMNEDASSFGVVASSVEGSVDILPGLAYNSQMEAIVSRDRITVSLGSVVEGQDKWIVLRRAVTANELGTVSIQTDGSLTGIGTEFTKVLRGQPNFPTKVRFTSSSQNIREYEVVSVISDTSAVLSGGFVAESGQKYSVIGTFTPGFIPAAGNKEIYEHDYFEIEVITSDAKPELTEDEYILARMAYNVGGTYTILDLRGDYSFSMESISADAESSEGMNPLVSLLGVRRVGGTAVGEQFATLEFLIEYAYKIISFDYVSTGSGWALTISEGSCNALNELETLPDGLFNGFIVLNRENMKSAKILSQVGMVLNIENKEGAAQLLSELPDLIVIPDFAQLEAAIKVETNAVMTEIPFTKVSGIADGRMRLAVNLEYPNLISGEIVETETVKSAVNITLKYRMFSADGRRGYPYVFNTATYHDYLDDVDKTAGNGAIVVNIGNVVPM